MADEAVPSVTPAVEAAPISTTPIAETVPAAPAAPSPDAQVAAPAAEPAKTEPAAVESETKSVGDTFLTDQPKPETKAPEGETKPAEAKPADGAEKALEGEKKEEASKSDEPAPLPTYEPPTLPEGITVDSEQLKAFDQVLGSFENDTKADHAKTVAFRQSLVDFHVSQLKTAVEQRDAQFVDAWNNQLKTWREETLADPEVGGNRFQTAIDAANKFIRMHGGTDAEQQELREALKNSGMGVHRAIIRTFARAGEAMGEGKPLVATTPPPAPKSKVQTLYGRSS